MSWSYDTSLSSYKDKVRFLSGDTVERDNESVSDEEIAALENIEPNLYLAAAQVAENIGLVIARRAYLVDTAANVQGGIRIDRRDLPQWWFKRAASLKDRAVNAAMNADEIINSFAFVVDDYGCDVSDYGDGDDVQC